MPTHTVRSKCDKGNCANGGPLSPVMSYQAGKAKFPGNNIQDNETIPVCSVHGGQTSPLSVRAQSQRGRPFHKPSVSLCGARSPNLSLEEVYIVRVFSFFLFLFFLFLQFRFSFSSPQNRFSSKIAIKSLWKFMSIVAAIASRLLLSCSRRRASSLCWSSGFCVVGCGGVGG